MTRSEDPKDTLEEKMFSGWEGLAKAVILRAADDYLHARRIILRGRPPVTVRRARAQAQALERFFRSRWFDCLADIDGEEMIARLREKEKAPDPKGRKHPQYSVYTNVVQYGQPAIPPYTKPVVLPYIKPAISPYSKTTKAHNSKTMKAHNSKTTKAQNSKTKKEAGK